MGHVVRAAALAWHVKEAGHTPVIYFTWARYTYAAAFLQKMGIDYTFFAHTDWKHDVHDEVMCLQPDLIVTMEFPYGIHGEWATEDAKGWEFVHVARYVKWEDYTKKFEIDKTIGETVMKRVIAIEQLSPVQDRILRLKSSEFKTTAGWLLFPSEAIEEQIPNQVVTMLTHPHSHLVIHNGPEKEIEILHQKACHNAEKFDAPVLLVCPDKPNYLRQVYWSNQAHWIDYFPARHLIKYAGWVYTAGGYNAMGECCRHQRHKTFSFPRAYDEQSKRVKNQREGKHLWSGSSTSSIARYIVHTTEDNEK